MFFFYVGTGTQPVYLGGWGKEAWRPLEGGAGQKAEREDQRAGRASIRLNGTTGKTNQTSTRIGLHGQQRRPGGGAGESSSLVRQPESGARRGTA